ncbi:MAG: PQQ-binding-like beta-propeller repeat protein [Thaumarchaeota archaeon]|nr:PQQ-binding-like beta-propeller repeat protein [Nitrososphaerota archaeon]
MINSRWLVLSVSVIAILVFSTVFVAVPITPRASAQAQLPREQRNWEYINHDQQGGSYNPQNQINKDNAQLLELQWIMPYPPKQYPEYPPGSAFGSRTPAIVVDGIVYVATELQDIMAIDAASGKRLWTARPEYEVKAFQAKNTHVRTGIGLGAHIHAINYYKDLGVVITNSIFCEVNAFDALTGKVKFKISNTCGTPEEAKAWGNQGLYGGGGSHPPAIFGNILIHPEASSIGYGARTFFSGYDITTGKRLWQTFLQPPGGDLQPDPDWALRECDKGWFFNAKQWYAGGKIATRCKDVNPEVLKGDWIATFDDAMAGAKKGKVHDANTVTNIWGHYPVDPETGIVYIGTGENSPWGNSTHHPGPNLYADTILALDARTGKFVWWFQSGPHDHWDWDCSWNGHLTKIDNRKVYIKACKNGVMFALDALTGEPIWAHDMGGPPGTCTKEIMAVEGKICPGGLKRAKYATMDWLDPTSKESMTKPWANYPDTKPYQQSGGGSGIESDTACDAKRCYMGGVNLPVWQSVGPVFPGAQGGKKPLSPPTRGPQNATIEAVDKNTGKLLWSFFLPSGFRGGLTSSGGVLYAGSGDGFLYMLDTETGKLIQKKLVGTPLFTQVTAGADANGKMKIFVQTSNAFGPWGQSVPGALMAYGLPDKLPEPQVITKEVIKEVVKEVPKEVIKEVIKEVPKEVIKEVPKEVIKEVPKEVTKTVTVETLSPITYVGIGLGIIVAVVGIVIGRRGRKVA